MTRSDRIQEWLADRLSFVQYPNLRAADVATKTASRSGLHFVHAMPIGKRIDLFFLSLLLLALGLAAGCALVLFIYLLI